MKNPVVIYGVGQLGAVFAHGLLRRGYPLVPVNRGDDPVEVARLYTHPEAVIVTVGEAELEAVLRTLPTTWRDRVVLVQNELLPVDWLPHGVEPTIAVVWFEKKKATPITPILPTVVAGGRASIVVEALEALEIPVEPVGPCDAITPIPPPVHEGKIVDALVAKNLYILTANFAGLEVDADVGTLWSEHRALMEEVAREVLALQAARLGEAVDEAAQLANLERAIEADPRHGARGRSAPARLRRALAQADALGVEIPRLRAIGAGHLG
ncbi:MAG: hypothetical protein KF901_30950 [Myxococcales bacterium]|nr:hypothetical protein [Myxococcales bacterium]